MHIKKITKILFITLTLFVTVFIAAAILIPVFYKDKIFALAKTEIDNNIDANVNFNDIKLSLFNHFPHLSVRLEQLSITGKETFKKDTLISVPKIDISLDLLKAIKGNYDILNITIIKARIHAIKHASGVANWNIIKSSPTNAGTTPAKHFSMKLRKYAIENAYIEYKDEQSKIFATLENLNHSGKGNFNNANFTLKTKTTSDAITVVSGKIPYLHKVKTEVLSDFEVDNSKNKYSFDTKDIKMNGLSLSAKGSIQQKDSTTTILDIEFNTPSNDFKDILSLIPGIYQNNFSNLKTTGTALLQGKVKGTLSKNKLPSFNLNLEINNGTFQYPDLPQKVSDIQVKIAVLNTDGDIDHTEVNIEKAHLLFGSEPLDLHILLKHPITSQWIDANAKGHIDLSRLNEFIKLDKDTKLTGIINADVTVIGSLLAAENKILDSIDARGTINIENLKYKSNDIPDVANISSMLLTFSPENVTLSNLKVQFLESNFTVEGNIDNLLSYYLHNHVLTGTVHIAADKIDGNRWKKAFTQPKAESHTEESKPFLAPSNVNISLNGSIDEIEYDHVKIKNVNGLMEIGDEVINIKNVAAHALDGEVTIDGYYSTKKDKIKPEMNFDYIVSLGKLKILHRHIGGEKE